MSTCSTPLALSRVLAAACCSFLLATGSTAIPATIPNGFALAPNGEIDAIQSFTPGANTNSTAVPAPLIFDVSDLFDGQLSLGDDGSVTLEFVDNSLSSGDWVGVWENGRLEGATISLGTNATTFYTASVFGDTPTTQSNLPGPTSFFDVDSVISANGLAANTVFSFLRIEDDGIPLPPNLDLNGAHGYDLIAAAQLVPVPEPQLLLMMTAVAAGLARRAFGRHA